MFKMFHGSTYNFDQFDTSKIRADESDAPYNGFWFSDDSNTLPAWTKLNCIYEVSIELKNPAPHHIIREIAKQLDNDNNFREESRSFADEIRYRLLDLGYDGVIHNDVPNINIDEYEAGNEVEFSTVRGTKYIIQKTEDNGCDLYDKYKDFITGYIDLDDFLSQQEKTYVVFKSEQIKILNKTEIKYGN